MNEIMVNESFKSAITSLKNITRNGVRSDGNCVVSADELNLVLEAAANGIELKKEAENHEGTHYWALCFGADHFEGLPDSLVCHINMLEDTSYSKDSMPSFLLCEKDINNVRFGLRAWVGFDEDDEDKTNFIFDLGLNVNDSFEFESSAKVAELFSEFDSSIEVAATGADKQYEKVIELIQATRDNTFPDRLEHFIINNGLCDSD